MDPVYIKIAAHDAVPIQEPGVPEAKDALLFSWGADIPPEVEKERFSELLQSSFSSEQLDLAKTVPRRNGFVDTAIEAYSTHHDLVIRPDDVWISILSQFSFYVNAHSEELRSSFVAHEGQKQLEVVGNGTRYTADFGKLAQQMTKRIHENVVDPSLTDWILPSFSTTTDNDTVVSAVLMMATLKTYFTYKMSLRCGLPSVTLLGTKQDWENILSRIDKLDTFGEESTQWASLLRPILRRFVEAFDGKRDIEFWQRICHRHSGGSGPSRYSGWITAFCVWSPKGKWQGRSPGHFPFCDRTKEQLTLDGTSYPLIETGDVPAGFAEVDVLLDDNGAMFDCLMVAGHVGYQVVGSKGDGVQPMPAWFMFTKGPQKN